MSILNTHISSSAPDTRQCSMDILIFAHRPNDHRCREFQFSPVRHPLSLLNNFGILYTLFQMIWITTYSDQTYCKCYFHSLSVPDISYVLNMCHTLNHWRSHGVHPWWSHGVQEVINLNINILPTHAIATMPYFFKIKGVITTKYYLQLLRLLTTFLT